MADYIVSARKYRPSTFKTVVGQKALVQTLKNAIASGKLAHAYLFCGPRGVGKTTCARIFAKTINCEHRTEDGEACNECESCQSFQEQRSYNVYELDAASNNSVDNIRELIDQVQIPPQIGKYKVFIIDEVHMLSTAAFNAFLKTLEEPPKHAIFVMCTTEKQKILPTILSRCQTYDFQRISTQDIVEQLTYIAGQESIRVEPRALQVIARKADGGMRDALSVFDQITSFTSGNVTYHVLPHHRRCLAGQSACCPDDARRLDSPWLRPPVLHRRMGRTLARPYGGTGSFDAETHRGRTRGSPTLRNAGQPLPALLPLQCGDDCQRM